jgi:hypothetical protein
VDDRVRVIVASDFFDFLVKLRGSELGQDADRFLAGAGQSLYYDGPKLIEAAIRIANLGRGVPIFRFDADVLFYGARSTVDPSQPANPNSANDTRDGIAALCRHYERLTEDASVGHFVFSGRYRGTRDSPADVFREGFATRTVQLADLKIPIDPAAQVAVPAEKSRWFFDKLIGLGANPYAQVTSGAGFCLSDGAIVDLPPFSNMRQNIIWIDDHLKHALHHELGHFELDRPHSRHGRVNDAVFDQIRFETGRPNAKDAEWHMQHYMIRLLLGCVADAWLRGDRKLKLPVPGAPGLSTTDPIELTCPDVEYFRTAGVSVPGVYAREFQKVLLASWGSREILPWMEENMRTRMWNSAVTRIGKFVTEFADQSELSWTYMDLFVKGYKAYPALEPPPNQSGILPKEFKEGLIAVADRLKLEPVPPRGRALAEKEVNRALVDALAVMVDDFIDYIKLVIFWKDFVQLIRFLLNLDREELDLKWLLPGKRGCVACPENSCQGCEYVTV